MTTKTIVSELEKWSLFIELTEKQPEIAFVEYFREKGIAMNISYDDKTVKFKETGNTYSFKEIQEMTWYKNELCLGN